MAAVNALQLHDLTVPRAFFFFGRTRRRYVGATPSDISGPP